jgi:hypothetical protein
MSVFTEISPAGVKLLPGDRQTNRGKVEPIAKFSSCFANAPDIGTESFTYAYHSQRRIRSSEILFQTNSNLIVNITKTF